MWYALISLYTYVRLGGKDCAVLLKIDTWSLDQVKTVRHWAQRHGLRSSLESPLTQPVRGMYLTIFPADPPSHQLVHVVN